MTDVCYVGGAGRLGLPIALRAHQCGHHVIVADINADLVEKINNRQRLGRMEPGVDDLLRVADDRLEATADIAAATCQSDLIFVIVPTPSLSNGSFSLEYVLAACVEIGKGLRGSKEKTVVIVSTTSPGDCRRQVKPVLEENSGLVCSRDFALIYSPEFVRQGSIIADFCNPDHLLIGIDDAIFHNPEEISRTGYSKLHNYYSGLITKAADSHCMSWESAELAKLGLNSALSLKILLAGQLTWLCQSIPHADAWSVLASISADRRIGPALLKPGLWPGGPCLPRDVLALGYTSSRVGIGAALPDGASAAIEQHQYNLASLIAQHPGKIGLLGITYKPGVDLPEGNFADRIATMLSRWEGRSVQAIDPSGVMISGLTHAPSIPALVTSSDILVLLTPWPEFDNITTLDLSEKVVIDCWGMFQRDLHCKKYIRLGDGGF